MKIYKCMTCKHYNSFFCSCDLYYEEKYIGEGDFDISPVNIRYIDKSECEYEKSGGVNRWQK